MQRIHLNNSEIVLAKRLARRRYESNREGDVEDQKIGPQSDYQTDVQGMLAEIAAAKYLNVYPDLLIENSAGGVDLTIPKVGTVDVKATTYPNGHLLVPTWKQDRHHADLYLMVVVDTKEKTLNLVGWIEAEKVFDQSNVRDFGHGDTFAVSQDELNPVTDLR